MGLLASLEAGTLGVVGTLIVGLIGAVIAIIKVGPERTNVIVTYQARALDDLQSENKRLIRENAELRERLSVVEETARSARNRVYDLERRIGLLEAGKPGTRRDDRPTKGA